MKTNTTRETNRQSLTHKVFLLIEKMRIKSVVTVFTPLKPPYIALLIMITKTLMWLAITQTNNSWMYSQDFANIDGAQEIRCNNTPT